MKLHYQTNYGLMEWLQVGYIEYKSKIEILASLIGQSELRTALYL